MIIFGIDGGYAYWKGVGNNRRVIFSSLAGEQQVSDFSPFSANGQYSISINGHGSWNLGETAEAQSSLAGHSQSYDWIFSPQYLAGLLLSISKCISPNTRDVRVRLATGLPYRDYQRGKDFRNQFKNHLIGDYHIERSGVKQTIIIQSVLQIPQAYGPIFSHLLNDKGEFINLPDNRDSIRVGSVNVGGNTVEIGTVDIDLAALRDGTIRLDVVEIGTRSRAIGVFTILPILREYVAEKFTGEYFSDYDLLNILKTGKVSRYDKDYPIDLSVVKAHLNRSILDFLSNTYRDEEKGKLFSIISTGGGANLVDLSGYHPNVWQSQEAQWDTCNGYMKLRKLLDKIGGK